MAELDSIKSKNVGFVGGGNMAQAIGLGLVKKGIIVHLILTFSSL